MNLTRCANGHFYDEDKYSACPHCGTEARNDNATQALQRNDNITIPATQAADDQVTSKITAPKVSSLNEVVQQASAGAIGRAITEDSPTIGYFGGAIGTEPVVGWVVCIKGNHFGEDFRLKSGRNFIGRSNGMDIAITGDSSVARDRHAVIIFDPKSGVFLVQEGEAKELSYINDNLIFTAQELEANDVLTIGNTKLMFIPCCSDKFRWENAEATTEDSDPEKA
jgi:hypothetical protein